MFVNNERYVIHLQNELCGQASSTIESEIPPIKQQLSDFIVMNYPKQKFLNIIFNMLIIHILINDDLSFSDFSTVHIADFFSFINNRFS